MDWKQKISKLLLAGTLAIAGIQSVEGAEITLWSRDGLNPRELSLQMARITGEEVGLFGPQLTALVDKLNGLNLTFNGEPLKFSIEQREFARPELIVRTGIQQLHLVWGLQRYGNIDQVVSGLGIWQVPVWGVGRPGPLPIYYPIPLDAETERILANIPIQ
jgi:hypothetical protein